MKKISLILIILMGFVFTTVADTVEEYQKLCDTGELHACVELATEYIEGRSLGKNYKAAKAYLELACQYENAKGCSRLGVLYIEGIGVKKDIGKAKVFFEKGCDLGDDEGCKSLIYVSEMKVNDHKRKIEHNKQYMNERFGFSLVYSTDIFVTKILSDNADGITLYNADRSLQLKAYGSWYGDNIREIYRDELGWAKEAGQKVTYKVLKKNWFVLSGIDKKKQTIFYKKTYFRAGKSTSFRFEYPVKDKAKYNSLVSIINKNFKVQ